MGDQISKLAGGLNIPVQPSDTLVGTGWLPGTWVKFSESVPTITPGAIAVVDKSDGTGIIAGILVTGPQHKNPMRQLSDMWNDNLQIAGGDTHADWTGIDAGGPLDFDKKNLLQRLGSRVVTMALAQETVWKNYVFETVSSVDAPLTYAVGDKLYVSSNGLTTKEKETIGHVWTGYVVAQVGNDVQGDFIIMLGAIG